MNAFDQMKAALFEAGAIMRSADRASGSGGGLKFKGTVSGV